MPQKTWFLHVQGETLGPLPPSKVVLMLEENEIQFADFAWTQGLKEWTRISDIAQFASMMPEAPSVPIPSDAGEAAPKAEKAPSLHVVPPPEPEAPPTPKRKAQEASAPVDTVPLRRATAAATAAVKAAGVATAAAAQAIKAPVTEAKIRRHERVELKGKIIVGTEKYTIHDISESGILVQLGDNLKVGFDIKFKVESDAFAKVLEMTGVVIRGDGAPKNTTAIEFTRVNPAHRRMIQDYVRQKLGTP
jgi:GYF domain 2/PilZ domain